MIVVAILSFIAVFIFVVTAYFWFNALSESPAAELKRRLRRMASESKTAGMPDDLREELLKETPLYERVLNRVPGYGLMAKMLERSGVAIGLEYFAAGVVLLVMAGFIISFLLVKSYLFAVLVAASIPLVVFLYLQYLANKRLDRFTEQLPDALTMLSRSLRAGHSLTSSFELIGSEMSDPLGGLFKTAYDQQRYGLRLSEALSNMLLRMESLDLRFFVMIIAINAEIGGNLSEILDKLASTIRERLKLRRQVRVLTAQGRLSGYILAVLPVVTFVLLQYVLLPGYEDVFLTEQKGQQILAFAIVAQIVGYLIINKIVNVRI